MPEDGSDRPGRPVLYSFRRCPYAMRARLAILTSGQQVELREVILRDKPAHMIALSPKATVPVLWLADGSVVEESIEIMHWALPDAASTLSAQDIALLHQIDTDFKHHLDRYKYANRYPDADALMHRNGCLAILDQIEQRLAAASAGNWLGGNVPGFIDLAILPFVRQFRIADETWFDAQSGLPCVRAWLASFLAWPAFQSVMHKYPQWRAGEAGVVFGRA